MNRTDTSDFHLACHLGQVDTVTAALDQWSKKGTAKSVDLPDEAGATGLIRAVQGYVTAAGDDARTSFRETIQALVDFGANTELRDGEGLAAIHWAVFLRANDLAKDLLQWGANVRRMDIKGRTPYHLAVLNSNPSAIQAIASVAGRGTIDISNKDGFSPLCVAAQKGELEVCEKLIELGADPNLPAEDSAGARRGPTPLHFAIYANQPEAFELLLKHGASPSIPDHRGRRVIHKASIISNPIYMNLIANHSKDMTSLESQNDEGATPLMLACQKESEEQVHSLLSKKVTTTTRDSSGKTALHYCVENDTPNIASALIDEHPDITNMQDNDGYSALHLAIIAGNQPLVELLLKKGADVAAVDNEGHTTIHWATVCGQVPLIDILADHGADLSKADSHGAYPVHYAAQMCGSNSENSDPETGLAVLEKLLTRNVPLDVTDHEGRQPLLWAASSASADACKVLQEKGAPPEASDRDGLTALHCAASRGYTDVTKVLLDKKVNPDSEDKNGCTPLFYAMTLGHTQCAELLMKKEANPSHQDTRGRSPAHCAAAKGDIESLKLLLKYKGDIWLQNMKGECPIHEASLAKQNETVAFILSKSKDPKAADVANQDGRTCLHIAALTNNVELSKLLLKKKANPQPVMTSKDDQKLTPYDAALLKGSSEVAEAIRTHLNKKDGEEDDEEEEEESAKEEKEEEKEGVSKIVKKGGKTKGKKKQKEQNEEKEQKGKPKNAKGKPKAKEEKGKEKENKEKEQKKKEENKEKEKKKKEKEAAKTEDAKEKGDEEEVKKNNEGKEKNDEKKEDEKEDSEKSAKDETEAAVADAPLTAAEIAKQILSGNSDNSEENDKNESKEAEDAKESEESGQLTAADIANKIKGINSGDKEEAALDDSDFFDDNKTSQVAPNVAASTERPSDDKLEIDESSSKDNDKNDEEGGQNDETDNKDNHETSAKDEDGDDDDDEDEADDEAATSDTQSSKRDSMSSSLATDTKSDEGSKRTVLRKPKNAAVVGGLLRSDTKLRPANNGIRKPDKNRQKAKLKDVIRRNTMPVEEPRAKASPPIVTTTTRPRTTSDEKMSSGSSESGYISPKRPKKLPRIRKPYKHEIQELVRIFESKSLAGSEINRSRKLTMYNTYKGNVSEKALVQNLVGDYNMRAREKSQDTFQRTEDWENYLKDVIYQADADEKAMKSGWKDEDRQGRLDEFVVPVKPFKSGSDDFALGAPWQRHTAPPRVEGKQKWDKKRRGSWEMARESNLVNAYGPPPSLPPEIFYFKYGQKPPGQRGQRPGNKGSAEKQMALPKISQRNYVGQQTKSYSQETKT